MRSLVIISLFSVLASASLAPAEAIYTLTDLGTLPGGYVTVPMAINNSGQVVGYAAPTSSGYDHAFLWTASGGMQDLGTFGGTSSRAYGINSIGQVVGYAQDSSNGYNHAFLWAAGGAMEDTGSLAYCYAYGINDSGQVAGTALANDGSCYAFLWTASEGRQYLGTLGGTNSYATAINNSGQVVGYAYTSANEQHAFIATVSGGMQDLGTLGGDWSQAYGIDDSGQVVGKAKTSDGYDHPFLWSASGGMQNFGALGINGIINNNGQLLGCGDRGSFVWTAGGGTQYINDSIDPQSGWVLRWAYDINELGQIIGIGADPGGQEHAVLLRPVPEPATLSLMAFGSLVMALSRRNGRFSRSRPQQ